MDSQNLIEHLCVPSMKLFKIEHSPLAYRFDLFFYGLAPVLLALLIFFYGPASGKGQWLTLAIFGFISWSLMEYALHRFILHGMAPFSRWHGEHHQRPMALICLPTAWSAGLIVMLVFLPCLWLWGLWSAAALTLGVLTGYSVYTFLHHATHHWHSQNAWFRMRRRDHALHHAMSRRTGMPGGYFGVTSHLWDQIFRTLER